MKKKSGSNSTLLALVVLIAALFLCMVIGLLRDEDRNIQLADGTYNITVESEPSMLRVEAAQLTVRDGAMQARLTLSGEDCGKLFMGTGAEASAADEGAYIPYVENGKYTYTVPVRALDTDIDCAVWSIEKEQWHDCVLVFSGLPESAYREGDAMQLILGWGVVVLIAFLSAGGVLWGGNQKKKR